MTFNLDNWTDKRIKGQLNQFCEDYIYIYIYIYR